MTAQYTTNGTYVVECSICHKDYETKSRSVGGGYQTAICPTCRPIAKKERDDIRYNRVFKDLPLTEMPPRRDLSDGEFMEKIGCIIHALIGNAAFDVKHGTNKQRTEARYFLLEGGIDDWVHFAGIEVSLPLRRMINEAADGYYKEEAI